jgi:hypothetical protein
MAGLGNTGRRRAGGSAPVVLAQSSGGGLAGLTSEPRGMLVAAVGMFLLVGGVAMGVSTVLFPHKAAVAAVVGPTPAQIALGQQPDLAELFAAVKEDFPGDYPVLQQQTDAQLAHGDVPGATWTAMRITSAITERDAPGVIEHADSEKLGDFMLRSAELLHVLQSKSPEACGKLAMGARNQEAVAPLLTDPAVLKAAIHAEIAKLAAIKGGQTRPKKYRAPANDELEMLGRAVMQQGMTRGDVGVFQAHDFASLQPEKRCTLVLKSFRAALGLPEPARSRFISQAAAVATAKFKK